MKTLMVTIIASLMSLMATTPCQYEDQATYIAYLSSDDMQENWISRVKALTQEYKNDKSAANLYKLALTEFGLLSSTMRTKNESLFNTYADITEDHIKILDKVEVYSGEANALLSSLYGFRMGYSPWEGMFLGPKSSSLMEKAVKSAPHSPLVWKLYGNSKFFTPQLFGGNLDDAIKGYTKSIALYQEQNCKHNWFLLDTYAFLGQAYVKINNSEKAIATYEEALQMEQQFAWVKNNLLPTARR